jgi:hypothetical protein
MSDIDLHHELRHRHNDLIKQAYYSGTIRDDESIRAALTELHSARILVSYRQGEYRLSKRIKDDLDDITQRSRSFATGQNFAAEIETLEQLMVAYERSFVEGNSNHCDRFMGEINETIDGIHDTVNLAVLDFQKAMDSQSSTMKSTQEKIQHNSYFLKLAMKLSETLDALNSDKMHSAFESDFLFDIKNHYHTAIDNYYTYWSSTLALSIATLQKYLFKLRQVENQTQRLRGFSSFLKTNSLRGAEDILEAGIRNNYILRRVNDSIPAPYPDFVSPRGKEALLPVVRMMKPVAAKTTVKRNPGERFADGDMFEIQDILSDEEVALLAFLARVDSSPDWQSAKGNMDATTGVLFVDFIEEVQKWAVSDRDCKRQVRIIDNGTHRWNSGNQEILDIEVCRAV